MDNIEDHQLEKSKIDEIKEKMSWTEYKFELPFLTDIGALDLIAHGSFENIIKDLTNIAAGKCNTPEDIRRYTTEFQSNDQVFAMALLMILWNQLHPPNK